MRIMIDNSEGLWKLTGREMVLNFTGGLEAQIKGDSNDGFFRELF